MGQSLPLHLAMPLGRFRWGESTCGAIIGDGGHIYPHTFQKWGGRGQQSCGDDLIVYWKTTAEHNDRVPAVLKMAENGLSHHKAKK